MGQKNALLMVTAAATITTCAVVATWLGPMWTAYANGPDSSGELDIMVEPITAPQPQLRCRTFTIELGDTLDLPGGEGEIADWVRAQDGYEVWAVDYEAVSKANGYPMHLVQVCLSS